jgi:gliding motility associated protien GldN
MGSFFFVIVLEAHQNMKTILLIQWMLLPFLLSGQGFIGDKPPVPLAPVREADIFWSKRVWQVIDMREKINQPFYYPTTKLLNLESFMQMILDAIRDSSLTAYDPQSDEFLIPISYDQIMNMLSSVDSVTLQNTDPPYNDIDTVLINPFYPTTVKQIRIKEDWFFDKQRSVMDVRIIGICPITEEYDEEGELKGTKPLFWIYYPQARYVFAQHDVFNRYNDAARLTYDDLFLKRFFSSYIYKESNVYDRKISEYAVGMDALLESERIKEEIFQEESDLWEY